MSGFNQCASPNNSPMRDFILKILLGNWGRGLFCNFFLLCMSEDLPSRAEVSLSDLSPNNEICQIWALNLANQNDLPEENWKKHPIKIIQTARGCNSGTLPLSLPMCLTTPTVLFTLLINTVIISLLSVFVGILFCKAKGPGPCH